MFKKEENQAKKYLKSKDNRISDVTKNRIERYLRKPEKQTGKGLKKKLCYSPQRSHRINQQIRAFSW